MATEQSARSSRFAVTCGLLSQYMKENGRAAAMSFLPGAGGGDAPDVKREVVEEEEKEVTTMELFPQHAGFEAPHDSEPRKAAQLTIFYGGKVLVLDDFPAERADDLMQLARSASEPAAARDAAADGAAADSQRPPQPVLSDLPIARKASLKRFLEKRKDRLSSANAHPYPPVKASWSANDASKNAKKDEQSASWLGLSPTLSLS